MVDASTSRGSAAGIQTEYPKLKDITPETLSRLLQTGDKLLIAPIASGKLLASGTYRRSRLDEGELIPVPQSAWGKPYFDWTERVKVTGIENVIPDTPWVLGVHQDHVNRYLTLSPAVSESPEVAELQRA